MCLPSPDNVLPTFFKFSPEDIAIFHLGIVIDVDENIFLMGGDDWEYDGGAEDSSDDDGSQEEDDDDFWA